MNANNDYRTEEYISLVERNSLPGFKRYMEIEQRFVSKTPGLQHKSVIDLGAGYGRMVPVLIGKCKIYIGIELNDDLFMTLESHATKERSVHAIRGNFLDLPAILEPLNSLLGESPIFLLLQNTLGTVELGGWPELIRTLKQCIKFYKAECIVSILHAESLETFGMDFYRSIEPIAGRPDEPACDFQNGIFKADSGYRSKWFTELERNGLPSTLESTVIRKVQDKHFTLLHLSS